ncbi:MAG TPA: ANTAR domain-containing protein [Stellaceae bacterium]|nr:ANTAR domain-containing protein [Stellaceae bacterium]
MDTSAPKIPLRVLLADTDQGRAAAFEQSLLSDDAVSIVRLGRNENLTDAAKACAPDVIIVDMSLPDRDALESVRAVAVQDPRPIVLFVDHDDPAFMEEAVAAGVSSYNVVGAALPDVKPIVRAAVAIFQRHQQLETELRRAEGSLAERRRVDRAKAILMKRRGFSEPEAYRWLQRRAMNAGRRIAEIAGEVLDDAGQ